MQPMQPTLLQLSICPTSLPSSCRSNPDVGRAELKRFHEVQEAYRVLRDEERRRQYDTMRVRPAC